MKESCSPLAERSTALVISGAAALVFAVFWINNLVLALQYHIALFRGTKAAAQGLFGFLRWSAADVSTVSTFIPFFGFLLIFAGLRRVRNTDDWPFFEGYDRFNIALGLIGTLWGIILIGYYPAKEISVESLMKCLHTAMFSTLISVIWVMVLEPVILRPWMNALKRNAFDESPEDTSLKESMNAFWSGMDRGGKAVRDMGESASEFHKELTTLNAALRETRSTENAHAAKLAECLRELNALLGVFQTLANGLAEERKKLLSDKSALEENLSDCQDELAKAQLETRDANHRAAVLQDDFDKVSQARKTLDQCNQALEKDAAVLKEKIADLEANNRQLASQLAAIREALQ